MPCALVHQHGANNMGGPKDSATSQQGLAPVLALAPVEVGGDSVRRESERSGRVTPSNGGSMRGGLHAVQDRAHVARPLSPSAPRHLI